MPSIMSSTWGDNMSPIHPKKILPRVHLYKPFEYKGSFWIRDVVKYFDKHGSNRVISLEKCIKSGKVIE